MKLRIFKILLTMMKFGPFKWQVIGERPNDYEIRIVLPNKLLAINEAVRRPFTLIPIRGHERRVPGQNVIEW